jgi:hypothetical protein
MTYPPGNPGYQPVHQPSQFGGPPQQFNRLPEQIPPAPPAPAGPSKLPMYLTAAVVALGLLVFGFNFAPQFAGGGEPGHADVLAVLPVLLAVLAALLAGVSLLPKQKPFKAWVAILAVLALLLAITELIQAPSNTPAAWGLYCVLAFSALQAGCAVAALLLDAGVITAPAPRPADPYYNAPGQLHGQFYGQGGPQQLGPRGPQPRPEYGQQGGQYYGQQGGFPGQGPGGYSDFGRHQGNPQHSVDSGPPTPPTGFPAFGQPQAPSSAASEAGSTYSPAAEASAESAGSEPTTTFPQHQAPQQSGSTSS